MNKSGQTFTLKDFSNIDNSEHADFLISSMEAHYDLDDIKKIKQHTINSLQLKKGETVIELGSGLGYEADAIAKIIGNKSHITVVDISKRMLEEAAKRSKNSNIIFCQGDANDLTFSDNSFSACYIDRLLVSQDEPKQVLSEAIRVLKSGGKLSVTDLDFSTMKLLPNMGNITQPMINYWQQLVKNPLVGQQLASYFKEFNLNNIKYSSSVFSIKNYEIIKKIVPFENMIKDMVNAGYITKSNASEIIATMKEADSKGEFFWSIEIITATGEKPKTPHHQPN